MNLYQPLKTSIIRRVFKLYVRPSKQINNKPANKHIKRSCFLQYLSTPRNTGPHSLR